MTSSAKLKRWGLASMEIPGETAKIIEDRTSGFLAFAMDRFPTSMDKAIEAAMRCAYTQGLIDGAFVAIERKIQIPQPPNQGEK